MKYMVMVEASQADYEAMNGRAPEHGPAWSEEDMRAMFAFMEEVNDDLARSGELVDANGLAEPARTRLVGVDDNGDTVITDDPYGKDDVLIAGYWVLDCESPERVTEIAARIARCPVPEGTPDRPVVVRPVPDAADGV
ncbi:YciI family protein [Streptomyces megasporus]|uniref:YciI family protein n=1 Tax=Streptomyces megasporus TaxID=44060 RepID=UPI0004E1EF9E|nr:YciI family protein [Streptomyces megasporus]